MSNAPVDAAVREEALDPTQSFIVQAPAGSGKTELLTRRVLKLLTLVDEPEEVLSITFTRKAASEMRARVVEALQAAAKGDEPENEYQREGIALAQAVLDRDKERDWQLLKNTQRLNLRTIDALCTTLAHRLPVVSQLGGPAGLVEDARPLYKRAAERLLDDSADELDLLLLQLGNRHEQVQNMLADLLGNRDQWSGYVYTDYTHDELREILEEKLQYLIMSRLDELNDAMPTELLASIVGLCSQIGPVYKTLLDAADNPKPNDLLKAQALNDLAGVPGCLIDDLPGWTAIANTLLTATGPNLRKPGGLNRNAGFPTAAKDAQIAGVAVDVLKERKQQMADILEELSRESSIAALLDEVRQLPSGRYGEKDWALLSQLLDKLPELLTELQLVFAEQGVIDFVEMTQRAKRSLGSEEAPTDLALALDMKIKHVLVDEFQDTSTTQFSLYRLLVAGWQVDDGRTFFAVGDPMQSIYRFREGDVTLFTHAQEQGIGEVYLQPLSLTVNFRAAPAVVDWVNSCFAGVFPEDSDDVTGAVPYASSVAHLETTGEVALHGLVDVDVETEAAHVAELTQDAIASPKDDNDKPNTVAILLRSRTQAAAIFKALQVNGISYQSVDLELLGNRHVVRDLLSLTLALRYPHDRLHWLAILRAPWCGLNLADLHVLMNETKHEGVFELLQQDERINNFSEEGQVRVRKFLKVLTPAVQQASRAALMPWVEACWQQLGGPVICADQIDLDAAERCIARLRTLEQNGQLWQPSVLRSSMESLYAASADVDAQVQVMTLHKSKGLEFDTVILPALDRKPRGNQQQILNWFKSGRDEDERLLIAPISERGLNSKDADKLNLLVRRANEQCDQQEKLRLLYVACTRAKKNLHLLARAKTNVDGELGSVDKRSLLSPLWPLFEEQMLQNANTENDESTIGDEADNVTEFVDQGPEDKAPEDKALPPQPLQRLPSDWQMPEMDVFTWPEQAEREPTKAEEIEFSWAGSLARDIGTAVHDQMQILAQSDGPAREKIIASMESRVQLQLKNLGVSKDLLDKALKAVLRAVDSTLSDERGQWILDASHKESRSEWDLSAPVDGVVKRIKIDRTFVDADNVRWIIDYKTGDHRGSDQETFLDEEQTRYADQLQGYADILGRMEKRQVKAALYFPLLQGWREFDLATSVAGSEPIQGEFF